MTERTELSCEAVRGMLPLASGQDVGEPQARAVWSHLAACMACRVEYSEFLDIRSRLRELEPTAEATQSLPDGFFADLQRDIVARAQPVESERSRWPVWGGLAAAACLLGIVLANWDQPPGMFDRSPIPSQAARGVSSSLTPLGYPAQGLGARAQVDRMFGKDPLAEIDAAETESRTEDDAEPGETRR